MSRAHLGWLTCFLIVAGVFLALRVQMGNFIEVAGVSITPINQGEIGAVFLLFAAAYLFRKRLGIGVFGRLDAWLWAHVYLGALGLLFVWFHSRQRFSSEAWLPNAAMIVLILTAFSGLAGRLLYVVVPRRLGHLPDYDPPAALQARIAALETAAAAHAAFKSAHFQALYERLLRRPLDFAPAAPGWAEVQRGRAGLAADEAADFDRAATLLRQRGKLLWTLGRRRRYRQLLDGWWLVHLGLTEAGTVFAALHIIDALLIERRWQ